MLAISELIFEQNCSRAFARLGFLTMAFRRPEIAARSFIRGANSLLQNSFCAKADSAETPSASSMAEKSRSVAETRRSMAISARGNCETRYRGTQAVAT